MKSAQILREKINDPNHRTIGVIVTFHLWAELTEIIKNAGYDFMIVDNEHVAFDEELVSTVCTIGRMTDFPVLIRPPETEYSYIRRALDKGACGLMLPQVASTADLDRVRDGIYMQPRGKRRVGGPGNRWVKDYNYSTWKSTVEDDLVILPQIESPRGIENAEAIARHEVTTALAIGPYDLSTELGVCWQPDSPKLTDALQRIRHAGKSVGKNTMMVGDGKRLIQQGFNFMCVGEPSAMLEGAMTSSVAALRQGQGDPAASESHVP
jgi:2-keto-3-deoxy-L-rhamnonate aldolase RhmA